MSNGIEKTQEIDYEVTNLENTGSALATITKAEIDVQISTAHAYPRSLTNFRNKSMTMLMMNQEVAAECFYVIPRGGKTIEGPSVRLAEIVAAAYGNLRSGARVVAEEADFVVAQGICHDLENNVAVTFEVKRRIVDRSGNRFNSDMIGVTGNAASSIAFRNTVFRVVPKVLWLPLYDQARRVAKGDEKTFEVRREAVLVAFEKIKVPRKKVFDYLGIAGIQDMNADHLVTLVGIGNAIKSGEASVADLDKPLGEPMGTVKLAADSPIAQANPPAQPQSTPQEAPIAKNGQSTPAEPRMHDIAVLIGAKDTVFRGDVRRIVEDLPKVGAKLDKASKAWTMPAGRTHELLSLCDKKTVTWVEIDSNGNVVPQGDPDEEQHETLFNS